MSALHDMHCHLGFMSNAKRVAGDAAAEGTLLFANTVTPDEWSRMHAEFCDVGNVTVGFGLHPWWPDCGDGLGELLEEHSPRFIGEVGIDAGKRHSATLDKQVATFTTIARWCAGQGDRLLSIHSAHAAKQVLDILEDQGTLESCLCVFHWYSGPSDQLKRAIDDGCYFSVGPQMLKTGKGREYVKAIPLKRLLLETDDPPRQDENYPYAQFRRNLECAARGVADIKGEGALEVIDRTSRSLLSSP